MRRANPWQILIVLCGALLITGIDNTIVNVALPSIQTELGTTTSQLQWIVDAYTVMFAGTLVLAGSLGDRFGRKRLLILGLIIFAIGSAAAGLAATGAQLALCRAVMGIGGAFIMPSTLSIIVQVFREQRERAQAIGIWAGVSGLGIALGPLIGGLLLAHFHWNSVFWVNPPLALVVAGATWALVPESADPAKPRLDLVGAALWAVGLIALVCTIIEVPDAGLSSTTLLAFGIAVVSLAAFVWWELRAPRPIVPMSLFTDRTFDISIVLVMLLYFSLFGAMFFFPQFLQLVQGRTPLESGIAILPGALGLAVASMFSPRISERTGAKPIVVGGLAMVTIGLAMGSWFTRDTPAWYLALSIGLMGVGMGLTLPHATNGVLSAVPRERAGMGSAVNETTGEVGGALGVAILGALLSAAYRSNIDEALRQAGAAVASVPQAAIDSVRDSLASASLVIAELPPQYAEPARAVAGDAFVNGMDSALWIAAGITLLGAILAAVFFPRHLEPVSEG